jgi:hypothetical protein
MKRKIKYLLAVIFFTPTLGFAEENTEYKIPEKIIPGKFSGAVTFVSDYVGRGITVSNEGPGTSVKH